MILYNSANVIAALEVTGIGMLGIFIFMILFYFIIKLIDKVFPAKK